MTIRRLSLQRGGAGAGFTLLEVLVVVVVCGMLIAGLTQGSHMIAQFGDRQRVLLGSIDDLDAVDRTLRGLIEQMEPSGSLDLDHMDGNGRGLRFVTRLPAPGDAQATIRAEVRLQVDFRHRLRLRWAPRPHVDQPRQAASDITLLQGVAQIAISYRGAGPDQPWRAEWHDRVLPMLIRIHIAFAPGDPRWWPDIVAAPMQPLGTS